MIILEEDSHSAPSTSGERSPLKSPSSNPNVIVTRTPESLPQTPPPAYGSTSTAIRQDRDDIHLEIRKLFVPAPYTRRTFARFLYALFVALLIVTATSVLLGRVINAVNKVDHGPGRGRDRGRDRHGRDRERHWGVDKEWRIGRPDDKPIYHCVQAAERALPIQYPPRIQCVDDSVVGKADVQLNSLS